MTRDEMFASVKAAVLADVEELRDPDDPEWDDWIETCGVTASNLKELAAFAQGAGWDLPTFVRFVLAHSGWEHEDVMMSFNGWST